MASVGGALAMTSPRQGWTDQRVEQTIGRLLRNGLIIAAVVVVIGAIIYLIRHGAQRPEYELFRGEPADLRSIGGMLRQSAEWRGRNLIQLGLVLLLATPVARVAFSVVAFVLQRDRLYVAVTFVVLAILLYSIAGGHL